MKLNILTSKLSIAIAALCICDFAIMFQLLLNPFEFSFWFIGIYTGLWGGFSVVIIEMKKAKPDDPSLPKYQTIGNLVILIAVLILIFKIIL